MILLLDKIFTMTFDLAKKAKELYSKFLRFNEELIRFINNHQFIKGFQISTKEFYKTDSRIISSIDEYITIQGHVDTEFETIELKDIMEDCQLVVVRSTNDLRKRTLYETLSDKNISESPVGKDEYFQNVFKSQYNVDEDQYNTMILKPVKEITQSTKKQLANVVGSDKRRFTKSPNEKGLKLLVKNTMEITKKPILVLGIINEDNNKPHYTPKKTATKINKNGVGFLFNSSISEQNGSAERKSRVDSLRRDRKKSMIPSRRKTGLGTNENIDFLPEFDEAIFETFPNNYSQDFKVENVWKVKDDGSIPNSNSTTRASILADR